IDKVRAINQAAFSPDGKLIAAGVDDYPRGQFLVLLHPLSGKELGRLEIDTYQLAFSPDGRFLATTGAFDRRAFLLEVGTQRKVRELRTEATPISHLAFSPDSRTLVTTAGFQEGAKEETLTLWDLPTGQVRRTLVAPAGPRSNYLGF